MRARNLTDPSRPGPEHSLGKAAGSAQLGRPSLDGGRLVYARATTHENVIVSRRLGAKHKKRAKSTLVRSRTEGLSNPTVRGNSLLYVRSTRRGDHLKLRSLGWPWQGTDARLAPDGDALVDRARRRARLRHRDPRQPARVRRSSRWPAQSAADIAATGALRPRTGPF